SIYFLGGHFSHSHAEDGDEPREVKQSLGNKNKLQDNLRQNYRRSHTSVKRGFLTVSKTLYVRCLIVKKEQDRRLSDFKRAQLHLPSHTRLENLKKNLMNLILTSNTNSFLNVSSSDAKLPKSKSQHPAQPSAAPHSGFCLTTVTKGSETLVGASLARPQRPNYADLPSLILVPDDKCTTPHPTHNVPAGLRQTRRDKQRSPRTNQPRALTSTSGNISTTIQPR
ncbi:hypothetical protein T265_15295, partial [Opisthorchis viverrini]